MTSSLPRENKFENSGTMQRDSELTINLDENTKKINQQI